MHDSLITTIYIINVVLYFLSFSWIIMQNKHHCNCSKNWKYDFIKYYLIFLTILIALMIFNIIPKIFNNTIKYIIMISEIIYISIIFLYIRDLIKKRCSCS
jgi:hypothetical protein